MKPTSKQYGAFENIFDYLNENLFDNTLPDCMLRFTRRSNKTRGAFIPSSWSEDDENIKHEISLNPLLLEKQNKKEILAVICHNMVHLWQYTHSELSDGSRKYHNSQWVEKMESIGLTPYNNGKQGGAQTGRAVTQYPKSQGRFLNVCKNIPDEYLIPFRALNKQTDTKSSNNKISYACPTCQTKSWGKPGLRFICEPCARQALEEGVFDHIPESAREKISEFLDGYIFRETQLQTKAEGNPITI